jgi:hypothetical protein
MSTGACVAPSRRLPVLDGLEQLDWTTPESPTVEEECPALATSNNPRWPGGSVKAPARSRASRLESDSGWPQFTATKAGWPRSRTEQAGEEPFPVPVSSISTGACVLRFLNALALPGARSRGSRRSLGQGIHERPGSGSIRGWCRRKPSRTTESRLGRRDPQDHAGPWRHWS